MAKAGGKFSVNTSRGMKGVSAPKGSGGNAGSVKGKAKTGQGPGVGKVTKGGARNRD